MIYIELSSGDKEGSRLHLLQSNTIVHLLAVLGIQHLVFLWLLFISLCFIYLCLSVIRKLMAVQEKPMSDNKAPEIKYEVFINFRGSDTRRSFLSHLVDAFKRNHINAFVDNTLQRGHEIGPSLVKAIEGSSILLVIFSEKYASSHWCLDELVTIDECKEKYNRIVIPVFYYVEPTHVRHQSSDPYKKAFDEHEKKYETTKVKGWRDALNKYARIKGIEASEFRNDKELIDEIVNHINLELNKLAESADNSERHIAIDEKVASLESLIRKEPEGNDTRRVIGIWGMGGIGKTTLAKVVFKKLKSGYNGSYFLADEREQSQKYGIISLKKIIFSNLLECPDVEIEASDSVPAHIVGKTRRMKVLIVLDDVDDPKHPEQLLGALTNFAQGSIIIITTRYKQVLQTSMAKDNDTYHLTELSSDEALELFNLKAFEQRDDRWEEYKDLSKRVVNYAQGVPLVLTVLAAHLHGNPKEMWEGELDKLEKRPPGEVYELMIRSYDGLDSEQQQIFLDLACFFLRSHHKINVSDLECLLKDDESGKSVRSDLRRLEQKALITLYEDNCVSMHDVLKEMALKIARGEPIRDPGSRNRLWDPKDISEVLKTGKVSQDIRSIQIDFSKIKELKSIPDDVFAKMSRLQFLEISGIYKYHLIDPHCTLAKRLQSLPSELRFLYWDCYPLQSLPESFPVERLVILSLQAGNVEELWEGVKNLVNLKVVEVSWSKKLKKLPDLSKAKNLEVLNSHTCNSLHTIGKLPHSLKILDVYHCTSLQTLPELPPLIETLEASWCNSLHTIGKLPNSLKTLNVNRCTSLQTLPELPPLLETLDASSCESIHTIGKLPHSLKTLNVDRCKSLQTLPELPLLLETLDASWCESLHTIGKLPDSFKTLNVDYCTSLQTLLELPPLLETLNASGCESLHTIGKLPHSLKTLILDDCTSLQTLPELPPLLETLDASRCESIHPIGKFPHSLKTLNVGHCTSLQTLPELPLFLETLDARWCESLHTIGKLPHSLKTLNVDHCTSLQTLPELPPLLKTLDASGCKSLHTIGKLPDSFKTLHANWCKSFQTLPKLTLLLETLDARGCESLHTIGKLPHSLKTLNVFECTSLQTLLELPPLLETLDVIGCESLHTIGKLPHSIKTLNVDRCKSLQTLPELPPLLETLNAICCESLHTIGKLPDSLKTLNVFECISLQTLLELPPLLETLDTIGCESLHTIRKLPHSIKTLNVDRCKSLQTLPELPPLLETLDARYCKSLHTIGKLPHSLKTLNVDHCTLLQTLLELPPLLEILDARRCKSLHTIGKLPHSLKTLIVDDCTSLQTLPELPPFLETLDASGCESIHPIGKLPHSLKTLNVGHCTSLQTLPELPPLLETVSASRCKSLHTIGKLPHSLKSLNVFDCTSLQTLPELPPLLDTLDVRWCKSLHTIGKRPNSL